MEDKKSYTVYQVVDTRNGEIIYIGQTKDFAMRKYTHFRGDKAPIDKYMKEEGRDNFYMVVIQQNISTREEAVKLEDKLICELQPLMNKRRSGYIEKLDKAAYHASWYNNNKDKWKAYYKEWSEKRKAEKSNTIVLF